METRALVEAVRAHLEWLEQTGIEELAIGRRGAQAEGAKQESRDRGSEGTGERRAGPKGDGGMVAVSESRPRIKASPMSGELFAEPAVIGSASLADLSGALAGCQRCKLAPGRTNIVFGVGNPRAEILFVGEGPGEEEDLRAEPFVGRAGQLLTQIITNGMKLRREDVYIANIVKCRPENNRAPQPDEIAACMPFLRRQIELIEPKVIVALGAVAVQALLGEPVSITRIRGVWQDYRGILLMPTFHPAYLLRNPSQKRVVWEDIRKVMREVGIDR